MTILCQEVQMRSEMAIAFDSWRFFLPPEWASLSTSLNPQENDTETVKAAKTAQQKKWASLPDDCKPAFLIKARERFWKLLQDGMDTTDFDLLTQGNDEIISGVLTDPTMLIEIVSRVRSPVEALADYYMATLDASKDLLSKPVMTHGEWNKDIIVAKAKLVANFQGQVNALIKLNQELRVSSRRPLSLPNRKVNPEETIETVGYELPDFDPTEEEPINIVEEKKGE